MYQWTRQGYQLLEPDDPDAFIECECGAEFEVADAPQRWRVTGRTLACPECGHVYRLDEYNGDGADVEGGVLPF